MRGNVVADVYAYGANLLSADPDTGMFRYPVGPDIQRQQYTHYCRFQFPYILAHAKTDLSEVKDWIADKLSRTMVRNAAAPIGMKNSYSISSQHLWRHSYVLRSPEPSYGENRRVLQKQQYVASSALRSGLRQFLLQPQGTVIRHYPQVRGTTGLRKRRGTHQLSATTSGSGWPRLADPLLFRARPRVE